jgi:hypothetical protein
MFPPWDGLVLKALESGACGALFMEKGRLRPAGEARNYNANPCPLPVSQSLSVQALSGASLMNAGAFS